MLPLVAASMAPSVGEAPQPHPQQQQWRRRHGRWRGGASARGGTEMTGLLLGSLVCTCLHAWDCCCVLTRVVGGGFSVDPPLRLTCLGSSIRLIHVFA